MMKKIGLNNFLFFILIYCLFSSSAFCESIALEEQIKKFSKGNSEYSAFDLSKLLIKEAEEKDDTAYVASLINQKLGRDFKKYFSPLLLVRIEEILISPTPAKAKPLVRLADILLPSGDLTLKNINEMFVLAKEISAEDFVLSEAKLKWIRSRARGVSEKKIIESQIIYKVEQKAYRALAEDNLGEVFVLQSFVLKDYFNSSLRESLYEAMTKLKEDLEKRPTKLIMNWVYDAPRVQSLIAWAEDERPEFGQILGELYEFRTRYEMGKNNPILVENYFQKTISFRPDLNAKNNKLRIDLIDFFMILDENELASNILSKLSNYQSIPITLKINYLFRGLYGKGILFFLIFVFLLLIGISFLLFYRLIIQKKVNVLETKAETMDGFSKINTTGFTNRNRDSQIFNFSSSPSDEYGRLLAMFGLPDNASESEIKKAYREMLKSHHPDRTGGGKDDQTEFIRLKKAYERIFAIRKSMF